MNSDHNMKIYPNPTDGKAMLDLGKEYPSVKIKVQDITGSTITEESYANIQFCDVELDAMKDGIFFVTITTNENEKVTMRLIKN